MRVCPSIARTASRSWWCSRISIATPMTEIVGLQHWVADDPAVRLAEPPDVLAGDRAPDLALAALAPARPEERCICRDVVGERGQVLRHGVEVSHAQCRHGSGSTGSQGRSDGRSRPMLSEGV